MELVLCCLHLLSSFITAIFSYLLQYTVYYGIGLRSSLVAGRSAPLRQIWCPERVGSNAGAAEWPSYHELALFLSQKSQSANLCQSAITIEAKATNMTHNTNTITTTQALIIYTHTHRETWAPAHIQAHAHKQAHADSKHAAQAQKQGHTERRKHLRGKHRQTIKT